MVKALERFLDRYGVSKREPDYTLLCEIGGAFSFLPYENVTKILKDARSVSSESKLRSAEEVLEDHLRWGTGGTCFSLCNALQILLMECGFDSRIAMGDMHYGQNIHCAVVVPLDSRNFLLDPGYLLHEPMPLPDVGFELVQQTAMNRVRLVGETEEVFSLYTEENGQKKWRYRLRGSPVTRDEFVAHWIRSFSLNTMEQIMLSRVKSSGRIYFRKDRLETVNPVSRSKKAIAPAEVPELAQIFGLPADLISDAQRALLSRSILK
jgi:arylamine N-acetyltransferase